MGGTADDAGAVGPDARARRWALVLPHRAALLRIARARTANGCDAEDVVQEAMLRCVEFPGLDEQRVLPFLVSVTTRLSADHHRGAARTERLRDRLAGRETTTAPSPEDAVCDRAEAAWLARHARRLPDQQRAVLAARAAGLSSAEVAASLRLSVRAVESLLFRARDTLRRQRARTFGVLAMFRPGRRTRTALAASAAVVAVVGLPLRLPLPAGTPDRRPVAAPGPRVERRDAGGPVAGPRSGRGGPAGPLSVARVAVRRPTPSPSPSLLADVTLPTEDRVQVTEETDDYTPAERIGHCARYGVAVDYREPTEARPGELRVACRYPEHGDPNHPGD